MRRFESTVLVSLLVTLAAGCLSLAREDDTEAPPSALVPAYFYPAGPGLEAWRQLAENARTKNIEVILNPDSGPGKKPDPAYVKVASDLRKARGKILGYVPTNYAKRDIAALEQGVRAYASFYEVDGIFLDEMSGAKDFVPYYLKVRAMIKRVNAGIRIVGNPGQPWVDEGYMKAVDCLITFEGSAAKLDEYDPNRVSPWMKNYPATRFAIVVHTVPSREGMKKALRKAAETRAGWVFITNREMPNPYDALPAYWAEETRELAPRNRAIDAK
jgi:hypothetical protein